jgi:hypothetical protein
MRLRLALAVLAAAGLSARTAAAQWYWCEPAGAYYPYVQICPVPWRPVLPHPYAATPQPAPGGQPAPLASRPPGQINDQTDAYRQGEADWQSLQAWFEAQTGDRRAGADFWANNRSKVGHKSCQAAADDFSGDKAEFVGGCLEAKQRLDPIDVRRRNEPEYRAGFNNGAKQLPLRADAAPQPETPPPTPTPSPSVTYYDTDALVAAGHDCISRAFRAAPNNGDYAAICSAFFTLAYCQRGYHNREALTRGSLDATNDLMLLVGRPPLAFEQRLVDSVNRGLPADFDACAKSLRTVDAFIKGATSGTK